MIAQKASERHGDRGPAAEAKRAVQKLRRNFGHARAKLLKNPGEACELGASRARKSYAWVEDSATPTGFEPVLQA